MPSMDNSSSAHCHCSNSNRQQPLPRQMMAMGKRRQHRPPVQRTTLFSGQAMLAALFLLLLAMVWPAAVMGQGTATAANSGGRGEDTNNAIGETGTTTRHGLAAYDNEIISEPEITCGPGIVRFNVKTSRGSASTVYVRGQSQNPDCTFHDTRNVTIELAKCNVRRKREVKPDPGIAYQMTVVVQLHPLFVTKVDRAYNVNCFYREKPQDVSVDFGVSELITQQIMSDAVLPTCSYSVHRDSPNGPRVKYTHVGEQLYHVWDCPSKMYSMLLYNCLATDGKGAEHSIVDANGCSKDEYLMPQITYTQDRTKAMTASSAFNFPDRNTMTFQCKIKLCMNSDAECANLTPPNCNGKRAKSLSNNGNFNEDLLLAGEENAAANGTAATETGSSSTTSTTGGSWETSTGTTSTTAFGRAGRVEVSGEVKHQQQEERQQRREEFPSARQSERQQSGQSSPTTEAIGSSTATSTSATNSPSTPSPSFFTPSSSPSTTTTSTSASSTTSTATTASSSTAKGSSSTTGEQLLSSVEKMGASSAERDNSAAEPAGHRSGSLPSSWATSSSSEHGGAAAAANNEAAVASTELPSDFPRPGNLLKDQPEGMTPETSGTKKAGRMERLMESREKGVGDDEEEEEEDNDRADPDWTIAVDERREKKARASKSRMGGQKAEAMDEEFKGTTKPVQVFDKRASRGMGPLPLTADHAQPALAAAKAGEKSPARAQRDTTKGPTGGQSSGNNARRRLSHEVDFDISSPELMIMDDYEPSAAAQKGPVQRSSSSTVQEAPFIDWSSAADKEGSRAGPASANGGGICLSPVAVICAGILVALLLLATALVLAKTMGNRKRGTNLEHSIYSQ